MASFYVDQVIEYRPRITGGVVIGVVTAVRDIPRFGTAVTFRITDGNSLYRTGSTESMFAEDLL